MNTQTQKLFKRAIDAIGELSRTSFYDELIDECEEALATEQVREEDSRVRQNDVQPAQDDIIEEQKRTITALNMLIGGDGSTTTENITRISRLEAEIERLKQPTQEPVLIQWYDEEEDEWEDTDERYYQHYADKGHKIRFLYTHQAPSCQECENLKHDLEGYMEANKALINREWQGLNDDDVEAIKTKAIVGAKALKVDKLLHLIVNLSEQALKEKNT